MRKGVWVSCGSRGALRCWKRRRSVGIVAYLGHRGLGQQNTADALGWGDDLLDQHAVEQGNQTLGHLGFVRAVRSDDLKSPPTWTGRKSKPSDSKTRRSRFPAKFFCFSPAQIIQVRRTRAGRGPQLEAPLAPDGLKQHRLQLACLTPSTYLKGARTTAVGFATRVFRAVTRRGLRSRRSAIANPRVRRTAPRARRSTRSRSGRDARSFGSRRAHSRPSSPFPSPRPSSCAVSPVNARR